MKTMRIAMLVALAGLWGIGMAYAASFENVEITAGVPDGSPELTIVLKELTEPNQPLPVTDVTAMNFGELTHALTAGGDAGVWYSQKYYCALIFATSYGSKYEVKSTCTGLTSGANSLPAASFGVTPAYAKEDKWVWVGGEKAQGDMPETAELGIAGSAVATDKLIYRSEAAASNRIIRAFYSLPCKTAGGADPFPGYAPISLDQPNGTYTGTVTITIAVY